MMNVLSLFDGMSCGQIALDRAGIRYANYYAAEIDKHAIKVARHNYPNTIHLGDITQVSSENLPKIDLLIGGSPCQGFSFAGKQLNFDDPRSRLFFEYVRLLKECKPKYFLLENVKMKREYQDVITSALAEYLYPGDVWEALDAPAKFRHRQTGAIETFGSIEINSALVSAQNRRRLYWTNIPNVVKPADKGIRLVDIIEPGVGSKEKIIPGGVELHVGVASNGKRIFISHEISTPHGFTEARTPEGKLFRRQVREATGKDTTKRCPEHRMYKPLDTGKANCLVATESPLNIIRTECDCLRALTTLERERLQTVPDGYTAAVNSRQANKMLGNGWTVDVVAHIFGRMLN